MKRFILSALVAFTALTSCVQKKSEAQSTAGVSKTVLKIPESPLIMDQGQKIEFLKTHYWDNFDFEDEKYPFLVDSAQIYALFIDYASLLMNDPYDTLSTAALMEKASANPAAFALFSSLADDVFHGVNSPYRNDEFYIPVLEAQLESPYLNEDEKLIPAAALEMARKNRLGHKANDFRYVTEKLDRAELIRAADETSGDQSESALAAAGKGIRPGSQTTNHLYGTEGDYILLYFNNPGCTMCREIRQSLMQSTLIDKLVNDGTLTILAVYPDENTDAWRAYHPYLPDSWINARDTDHQLFAQKLYYLEAIPSLYLLDKGKNVLAKDETDVRRLERILAQDIAATQGQPAQ